jgi:hypothetical protein
LKKGGLEHLIHCPVGEALGSVCLSFEEYVAHANITLNLFLSSTPGLVEARQVSFFPGRPANPDVIQWFRIQTCELPPGISNGVIEMHSRRLIVGDEDRR